MKAIITGASSGMGAEYARQLAIRGYDVILVARSEDKLKKIKSEINKIHKNKATILVADLTKSEDLAKVVEKAGETDLLINNAGITWLHDYQEKTINKTIVGLELNVVAPTKLTMEFARVFKKKNKGRIVNVGSTGAFSKSSPPFASYSPGKLYIERFTRSIRHDFELEKSKVKINLVHPASIRTEMLSNNNIDDTTKPLPSTPVEKFVKVALKRILDKNKKEFYYGKLGRIQKWMSKLTSAKFQARMQKKMTADYY